MTTSILPTVMIGGIPTINATRRALAEAMARDVYSSRAGVPGFPRVVIASNGSVIATYHRDRTFKALIDAADFIDPDGMPLVLTARLLLRTPGMERIATTDFIIDAAAMAEAEGARFFFLGGRPGVASRAAEVLRERFPGLQLAGTRHGYFGEDEIDGILEEIRSSGTDVLWLGLGSPRQEKFAIRYRHELHGLAWIRTCGGMFDHLGANIPRAPEWMQRVGLEWLHRASLEPRRLGFRYLLTNPAAVYHLLTKTR